MGDAGTVIPSLLEALGGASRIATIATYARDALIRIETSAGGGSRGDRDALHGVQGGRELTFRAAGGRVRIERRIARADGGEDQVTLALAGPEARHDHPARCGAGTDEARDAAGAGDAAPCAACAGDRALGEARLEPRTLLAHAGERGAVPGAGAGGAIEVKVEAPGEALVYRFDPRSRLCAEVVGRRGGERIAYRDWRMVGGVATPFLEIESRPGAVIERRILAVAYDLPWPDRLYRPDPRPHL